MSFKLRKSFSIIQFYYVIISIIISIGLVENSYITLKIKTKGEIKIYEKYTLWIHKDFGRDGGCPGITKPDEIYINDERQNEVTNYYSIETTDNTVKLVWYNRLGNTACLFSSCSAIDEVDLSNFDSTLVTKMSYMFKECTSLTSVNFQNFDTSKVEDMCYLFYGCNLLNSLDLSQFDTSKVTRMDSMFRMCRKISSLDLSNFRTSKVEDMSIMFYECFALKSLIISNFDTSQVIDMNNMFYRCYGLKYLDFSNFITDKVTNMNNMFTGIYYLNYLNLKNARINTATTNCIFCSISNEDFTVCSQDENWKNLLSKYNEIINCIDNIYNFEFKCYKYEKKLDDSSRKICEYCGLNFFRIYNNEYDSSTNINCYNSLKGYYLDETDLYYKKCYESCKTCDMFGNEDNHNCIECDNEFPFELTLSSYKNCYKKCKYYYFYDLILDKFFCTQEKNCNEDYNKLIISKNECIDHCYKDPVFKYEFNDTCFDKCPINTINNSYNCEYIDSITEQISNSIISSTNLDYSNNIVFSYNLNNIVNSNNISGSDYLFNTDELFISNELVQSNYSENLIKPNFSYISGISSQIFYNSDNIYNLDVENNLGNSGKISYIKN